MNFNPENYLTSNAWPFVEAKRVADHLDAKAKAGIPNKGYVLFETGYGPSGLPHIGTFGEVFRTTMVQHAFEKLMPGVPTKLICFSDDMDGLRKVPDNIPNKQLLIPHLNKPLTQVPDPFQQYPSFAAHNNAMLQRFLNDFGFNYEFRSSTEVYKSGQFNVALLQVLKHHQAIVDIIVPTLGAERAASYSPFLPVCPETGHVLQVPVIATDVTKGTITYRRTDGKEVETQVTDGLCKLQWKADWAMRWYALDVDYEMSGKDLIDSVTLGSAICRELGGTPPVNLTYEHFVDENGAKISKSKGNGLTIEEWLRYAPAETLSLFMYRKPTAAKKLFRAMIPATVDEYADLLDKYPTQDAKDALENPVFHIHNGQPITNPLPFSYAMVLNLVSVTAAAEPSTVWKYLNRVRPDITPVSHPQLDAVIAGAIHFYNDTIKPTQTYRTIQTDTERAALADVASFLKTLGGDEDADLIQTEFYELGKKHFGKDKLRDWFGFLYQTLLGFPNGPRLGSFVKVYGPTDTLELITQALQRA